MSWELAATVSGDTRVNKVVSLDSQFKSRFLIVKVGCSQPSPAWHKTAAGYFSPVVNVNGIGAVRGQPQEVYLTTQTILFDWTNDQSFQLEFIAQPWLRSVILNIWENTMPGYSNAIVAANSSSNVNSFTVPVDSTKSVLLSAANPSLTGRVIINTSRFADLLINLKDDASSTNFIYRAAKNGGTYETPFGWTGDVKGIWTGLDSTGSAKVWEFS